MGIDGFLSAIGLGEFAGDWYFIAQLVLACVSSFLFLCSIVVCGMAFKAAGAAKRARGEAGDLAVEVRHLTAQVEKATARRAGVRMPEVSEEPSETEFAAESPAEEVGPETSEFTESDRTLEEAKKAATVPSALLRRHIRKRRA